MKPGTTYMAKRAEPTDLFVGERIKTLRLAKGLSQTELANTLGVTFQQVQKYEKGVNRVSAGRLARLADLLGVKLTDFFPDNGRKLMSNADVVEASTNPLHIMSQTTRGQRLARVFAVLASEAQDVVIVVATALLGVQDANPHPPKKKKP